MTILPRKLEDWPEEWFFAFSERAGIKEFLGNLSRSEAERQAESEIRQLAETVEAEPDTQSPLWKELGG